MASKILFFTADWCGPCRKVKPAMKEIAQEYNVEVDELDVSQFQKLVQEFNVMGTPTLIVLDEEGLEIERVTGAKPKRDLVEALGLDQVPTYDNSVSQEVEDKRRGVLTSEQMRVQGGLK